MLSLLKNELIKISKWQLLMIWLAALLSIVLITGIIVLGLEKDGKLEEIVRQNIRSFHGTAEPWSGWAIASSLFSALFTKVTFLLFEAYLISRILIDEFRKRTINPLFSYPIAKSKMLWSKIFLVLILSFLGQSSAHLAIHMMIKLIAVFTGTHYMLTLDFFANLLGITLGTVFVGLLPFIFGMIKYSTVVTMLSALILAGLISNAMPGTLSGSVVNSFPFLLITSFLSLVIISISVRKISKQDIRVY